MVMRENRACWLASNTLPIPIFANVIEVRNLKLNSPVGEFDFSGSFLDRESSRTSPAPTHPTRPRTKYARFLLGYSPRTVRMQDCMQYGIYPLTRLQHR